MFCKSCKILNFLNVYKMPGSKPCKKGCTCGKHKRKGTRKVAKKGEKTKSGKVTKRVSYVTIPNVSESSLKLFKDIGKIKLFSNREKELRKHTFHYFKLEGIKRVPMKTFSTELNKIRREYMSFVR